MYHTISNFDNVKITKSNTLIICDIDETLLTWNKKLNDYHHVVKNYFNLLDNFNPTLEEIKKESQCLLNIHCTIYKPTMTDRKGFNNLLIRIEQTKSEIIFLTARSYNVFNKRFTRQNFKDIGLDQDKYYIHWSGNCISKGKYIKEYVPINKYNDVIFIDDRESFIKTVSDILPNITCYKFEADYQNIKHKSIIKKIDFNM